MPMASTTIRDLAASLIVTALLVLGLVLGRQVLVPFALATILAFILAPVVRFLIAHRPSPIARRAPWRSAA
jgi:predicted PurR-regulated permease PerM